MKKNMKLIFCFFCLIFISCGSINEQVVELEEEILIVEDVSNDDNNQDTNTVTKKLFKILSLGDSYTIGQSVCTTCKFPEQLKASLQSNIESDTTFNLEVIAKTGWTTTNLIEAIKNKNISNDYGLVTLLIGVNNQYQKKAFSIYENEFPALVNTSIRAAEGDKNKVIVISIPDYAFTPFGKGNTVISDEIDIYNNFAKDYCEENDITFVNITDITRLGLTNTALVANDGLHPSELAYSKFVEKILPFALDKLRN